MTSSSAGQVNVSISLADLKSMEVVQRFFKGNETLFRALRALFLGFEVTDDEKKLLSQFNPEIKEYIRNLLRPQLAKDNHFAFVPSGAWVNLDTEIKGYSVDTIQQAVKQHEWVNIFLDKAFELLEDPTGTPIDVSYSVQTKPANDPYESYLLGRNQYLRLVTTQLFKMWSIANREEKTPKEIAEAIRKDSTQ